MNIALTAEQKTVIENPKQGYCLVQKVLLQENAEDQKKEFFWVLGLKRDRNVLFLERFSLDRVTLSILPTNIFRFSLQNNADNIMLMLSHPARPWKSCINHSDVSERLIRAGLILAIDVSDYMFITTTDYLSFSENNIMPDLFDTTDRMPHMMDYHRKAAISKDIDKLVLLAQVSAKQLGKGEGISEVARNLVKQRLPLEDIARATGLTPEDIQSLPR